MIDFEKLAINEKVFKQCANTWTDDKNAEPPVELRVTAHAVGTYDVHIRGICTVLLNLRDIQCGVYNLLNFSGCGVPLCEIFSILDLSTRIPSSARGAVDCLYYTDSSVIEFFDNSILLRELSAHPVANNIRAAFPVKVIFNNPATIVIWSDGTKTIVKCGPNDTYSKEAGLALCYMKKSLGNKGNYNNMFRRWIKEEDHD